MTPSLLRELAWLEDAALRRGLGRRERRELERLERRYLRSPRRLREFAPLSEWRSLGRRGKQFARVQRVRSVVVCRAELVAALVRRVRALAPPLEAEPIHGRLCPPGCADCRAIQRWRTIYEVLSGADAVTRRYLFP